jgi:hypothetical protein
MEVEDGNLVFMELKYCERCGGLWLRVCGTQEVYCPSCAERMVETTWWCEKETTLRLAWRMKVSADATRRSLLITGRGNA